MHPATPPTPSRRPARAPKNPRRRVRSESDRKKHAGWRHCPRCNRSVSTNGRNFYHHMHKCDRVYFADLIARVDSAVTPVSTPLPPPVPRLHSSPLPASHPAPVKMSEMQRVTFLQQLCFLRVYDRTVDAVLKQIEQTDASICSPAAFEALRRAKGIDSHRRFPNPKHVSPPFSPLAPPVHPPHDFSSSPAHTPNLPTSAHPLTSHPLTSHPAPAGPVITNNPLPPGPLRDNASAFPNGVHPQTPTTPYSSNASISVTAPLPPPAAHPVNHAASPPRPSPTPVSAPASGPAMPQRSLHRHSVPVLPSTTAHVSQPVSAPATAQLPDHPFVGANVATNPGTPQDTNLHAHPMQPQNGMAASQQMRFARSTANDMHSMPTSAQIAITPATSAPANQFQPNQRQPDQVVQVQTSLPQNHQQFPQSASMDSACPAPQPHPGMASSINQPVASEAGWRRDPQRYSAPAGITPYAGALYTSSPTPGRQQMPPAPSMTTSATAAANTPVSRVASAMSISSVINS